MFGAARLYANGACRQDRFASRKARCSNRSDAEIIPSIPATRRLESDPTVRGRSWTWIGGRREADPNIPTRSAQAPAEKQGSVAGDGGFGCDEGPFFARKRGDGGFLGKTGKQTARGFVGWSQYLTHRRLFERDCESEGNSVYGIGETGIALLQRGKEPHSGQQSPTDPVRL